MWISRLANNARRGLNLNGLQELQNALRDPRFRFVLRDVINLARSNAANCSTNASSGSCLTNLATMRLLSGARDLVNLNEQYLSQIVATALDARNTSKRIYQIQLFDFEKNLGLKKTSKLNFIFWQVLLRLFVLVSC